MSKNIENNRIHQLRELKKKAKQLGGSIEVQFTKSKLSARERLNLLLDKDSFEEIDLLVIHRSQDFEMEKRKILGDGVVTGSGKIDGRLVFVFSQDSTVLGGSLSESNSEKVCKIMDIAMKVGAPIIGLNDSGGARIQEGILGLAGYANIFLKNTLASGVVPQISAILGPCAGGAAYSPAITDFIFMVKETSFMFVTGPQVVKTITNENITSEELGGAISSATKSGIAHFACENEQQCLKYIRKLISYIPSNWKDKLPLRKSNDIPDRKDNSLNTIVPENTQMIYNMKNIINIIVDNEENESSFFEVNEIFAPNIIIGFARLDGKPVGIVANQPSKMSGVLDIDASVKSARFIRFCDAFNIPLVVLVDVPGFMPGSYQEGRGIIKHGAKLLFAFSEATVPKITIIIRKAYGGAYAVMNSKHIRGDFNFAWPSAEIAVMGALGAVKIVFKKEMENIIDKEKFLQLKVSELTEKFSNPYIAAARGYIDEVIEPSETRKRLIKSLQILEKKQDLNPKKKHNNIPL